MYGLINDCQLSLQVRSIKHFLEGCSERRVERFRIIPLYVFISIITSRFNQLLF